VIGRYGERDGRMIRNVTSGAKPVFSGAGGLRQGAEQGVGQIPGKKKPAEAGMGR